MLHASRIKTTVIAGLFTALGAIGVHAADLTVGANIGNVPWEFEDASGKVTGFEIDLVNEIAKRLGKTVEFVNTPFNGLFPAVQSGRINMAVSSITITEKRLQSVSFAQPYYDSDQSLTVTAASGITGLKGMSGKVVGVDTGSTGDMWADSHKGEYKLGEIRRFEGLQPAMLDLVAGRVDGYISDIPALLYYAKDKPELKVVERIPTGENTRSCSTRAIRWQPKSTLSSPRSRAKASSPRCTRHGSVPRPKTRPRPSPSSTCRRPSKAHPSQLELHPAERQTLRRLAKGADPA